MKRLYILIFTLCLCVMLFSCDVKKPSGEESTATSTTGAITDSTDSSCGLTDASSGDATNDSQGGNGDGQEAIPPPIDGDSDYTIVFTDDPEICYLRFHDIRTYESRFVQEGTISFSSLEKLYDVLSNGKLEIYEKSIMSHWTSDENGIIICNFKNLYYPSGLPDCIELRNIVYMGIGGTYAFLIEPIKDNVLYSSMHIMESEMYKYSYDKAVKSLSQNYSNVQEKIIDGTTTVGRHYYRYDGRLMAVEYELNSQNKNICVIKKFFYEKTNISLYVQEDDVQYRVRLSCVNDIPDSELMKFSVSPYFSDNEDDTSNSGGSTAGDTTTPSEPPTEMMVPYSFDSYGELIANFSKEYAETSIIQGEKELFGEKFKGFVETITENSLLKLPALNGELMPLRNEEHFSNIDVFKEERYLLPRIWFHGEVDGKRVRVMLTYPLHIEVEEGMDASQILELIYPGAINVHNYEETGMFDYFYLDEIELKDRTLSAVILKRKERTGMEVSFYYDGYWTSIYTDFSIEDKEFWQSFELIGTDQVDDFLLNEFLDKHLTTKIPQFLTEEEKELLYNRELHESYVDIAGKAIIRVYEGIDLMNLNKAFTFEELLESAKATAPIKYMVLNGYNQIVRIVENEGDTSIRVVESEHPYNIPAKDLKTQSSKLDANEKYNIEAVYCFDDYESSGQFFICYVTDGGVFTMVYLKDNTKGILFAENEIFAN